MSYGYHCDYEWDNNEELGEHVRYRRDSGLVVAIVRRNTDTAWELLVHARYGAQRFVHFGMYRSKEQAMEAAPGEQGFDEKR